MVRRASLNYFIAEIEKSGYASLADLLRARLAFRVRTGLGVKAHALRFHDRRVFDSVNIKLTLEGVAENSSQEDD